MQTQVTRDPKKYHLIMAQHVGHDIYITQRANHTWLWCKTCSGNGQFVDQTNHYLVFKTYDDGIQRPVAFLQSDNPNADRVLD